MKSQKRITPVLLNDPEQPKLYRIRVECNNQRWAELTFSDRDMAQQEYNRIRSQSIYSGVWISNITLEEIKNETMA